MTHPTLYAQAILAADMELARAEAHLAAMTDHGSITEHRDAAARARAAHEALTEARKPLEAALVLTKSMSDNIALQVAHAIVQGETWPYSREGITEHTGWQPATEGWSQP
jgi:hypothetical protein